MLVRWELSAEKAPGKMKEKRRLVKCQQHGTVSASSVCSKAVRDKARVDAGQEAPARDSIWSPWEGLRILL